MPGNGFSSQLVQEFVVQRIGNLVAGFDDYLGAETVEDSRHAAQVVGVSVGDEGYRKSLCTLTHQKGHHHATAGITPIVPGSGIDHNPAAQWGSQYCAVTLP